MTTYDYERLWFDEIVTEGSFPRGAIAMEAVFEDDDGKKHVWAPKWQELQNMYAAAERVEDVNTGSGEHLDQLKALQQFSGPTLTRLAKCIDRHTSLRGLQSEFGDKVVGSRGITDKAEVEDVFNEAGFAGPDYPNSFNLANRWKFIRERLRELNQQDYNNIIEIIEVLVHRNRHIDAEERRRTIIEELNKALTYENMEITLDGRVTPITVLSDEDDGE